MAGQTQFLQLPQFIPSGNHQEGLVVSQLSDAILQRTVVEAFVKMVVCRKVTVQKISARDGQVLESHTKQEEDNPVILEVNRHETTDNVLSGSQSTNEKGKQSATDIDQQLVTVIGSQSMTTTVRKDEKTTNSQRHIQSNIHEKNSEESNSGSTVRSTKCVETTRPMRLAETSTSNDIHDTCSVEEATETPSRIQNVDIRSCHRTAESDVCSSPRNSYSQNALVSPTEKTNDDEVFIAGEPGGKTVNPHPISCIKIEPDDCFEIVPDITDESIDTSAPSDVQAMAGSHHYSQYVASDLPSNSPRNNPYKSVTSGMGNATWANSSFSSQSGDLGHCFERNVPASVDSSATIQGDQPYFLSGLEMNPKSEVVQNRDKIRQPQVGTRTMESRIHCQPLFYGKQMMQLCPSLNLGKRNYDCEVCGKSYKTRANLQVHMRKHTGDKPFACSQCGKRFAQSCVLRAHMRIHTGEKPYICSICGKGFSQGGHLAAHLKFHSGIRPFRCTICDKRFFQKSDLTKHLKIHDH